MTSGRARGERACVSWLLLLVCACACALHAHAETNFVQTHEQRARDDSPFWSRCEQSFGMSAYGSALYNGFVGDQVALFVVQTRECGLEPPLVSFSPPMDAVQGQGLTVHELTDDPRGSGSHLSPESQYRFRPDVLEQIVRWRIDYRLEHAGTMCVDVCAERPSAGDTVCLPRRCIEVAAQPRSADADRRRTQVVYVGSQLPFASYGVVGSGMAAQLRNDTELRLSLHHVVPDWALIRNPWMDVPLAVLEDRLRADTDELPDASDAHTIVISFDFPMRVFRQAGVRVFLLAWECSTFPPEWARQIAEIADELWVPTRYVRDALLRTGYPLARLRIVPYGVDQTLFHPAVPPAPVARGAGFVFLFNSGVMNRKGLDTLVRAYDEEFSADDDVCLVLNAAYVSMEMQHLTRNRVEHAPCLDLHVGRTAPSRVPSLYTAADVLVLPYRAEGFGIPLIEAAACGVPSIVTGAGASTDIVDERTAFLLPSVPRVCGPPCFNDGLSIELPIVERTHQSNAVFSFAERCLWDEVDVVDLRRALRYTFTHRDEVRARGEAARRHVLEHFTWSAVYEKHVRPRLRELRESFVRD